MRTKPLKNTSWYEIDIDGRIWSWSSNKWLSPSINAKGYSFYTIYLDSGKQKSILPHLEVWRKFKGPLPRGGICHIDGNKQNNSVDNLRANHDGAKFVELIKRGVSISKIAKYYGLPKKTISEYVSALIPGGIRELRKKYPLNKSLEI